MAEAIRIHYSKDALLNSKNEYNSNHLARVMVEEDAFNRKKKDRQEEMEEKRWEQFKGGDRRKPKRKPEEDWKVTRGDS